MSIRQIQHGVVCTLTLILTAGNQKGERFQTNFSVRNTVILQTHLVSEEALLVHRG